MASTKYDIYFANIISTETFLPVDAEELAFLEKQNNKIKSSCPRNPLILPTQTMTCRLNWLMSLKFIGILWAFNWYFLTLPFLISSSRVFNCVLWDYLTYNWMWVIICGVSLELLLTYLKSICAYVYLFRGGKSTHIKMRTIWYAMCLIVLSTIIFSLHKGHTS